MLFLNVYGSTDPFSHKMSFVRSMNSGDYSPTDIEKMYARFVRDYNNKVYSCLSAMLVEINCETNTVTTKENFRAAHPLREKKIINPQSLPAREKRQESRSKYHSLLSVGVNPHAAIQAMAQVNDELAILVNNNPVGEQF